MPSTSWPTKGILARPPGYWYAQTTMSGWATQTASPGNHSCVGLYNSGGPGMYLVVTHAAITSDNAITQSTAWWYRGNPGTIVAGSGVSIDPSLPPGPGSIITFTAPGAIGSNYAILPITGDGWQWGHEYPFIYLPPMYTVYFSAGPPDTDLSAWFQWWWTNTPY